MHAQQQAASNNQPCAKGKEEAGRQFRHQSQEIGRCEESCRTNTGDSVLMCSPQGGVLPQLPLCGAATPAIHPSIPAMPAAVHGSQEWVHSTAVMASLSRSWHRQHCSASASGTAGRHSLCSSSKLACGCGSHHCCPWLRSDSSALSTLPVVGVGARAPTASSSSGVCRRCCCALLPLRRADMLLLLLLLRLFPPTHHRPH